jgi:hypothetical protein
VSTCSPIGADALPTVTLPRLLQPASPDLAMEVEASTIGELLEGLFDRAPALRVHLTDETGELRDHVLCFVDGTATRLQDRAAAIGPAARVDFIQAVSGGS